MLTVQLTQTYIYVTRIFDVSERLLNVKLAGGANRCGVRVGFSKRVIGFDRSGTVARTNERHTHSLTGVFDTRVFKVTRAPWRAQTDI